MAFTKTHLIVLLIVTISMLFASTTNAIGIAIATKKPIGVRTPQACVWSICKKVTEPSLCFKTILPKALTTPKFNIYKALEVEIQAASVQINKTIPIISSFMPKYADNPDVSSSLRICKEQYEMMPDSITNAVAALAVHNAKEAQFQFGSISLSHRYCAEAFAESDKYRDIPFAADAKLVNDLATNCGDIANAIWDRVKRTP
jgi:pectinesterase inhibitor-like protein